MVFSLGQNSLFVSVIWFVSTTIFNLFFSFFVLFWFQNLIDLAGSESSKTETTGLRRKEGSYINKSLLTLGTVCKQKDLILLL